METQQSSQSESSADSGVILWGNILFFAGATVSFWVTSWMLTIYLRKGKSGPTALVASLLCADWLLAGAAIGQQICYFWIPDAIGRNDGEVTVADKIFRAVSQVGSLASGLLTAYLALFYYREVFLPLQGDPLPDTRRRRRFKTRHLIIVLILVFGVPSLAALFQGLYATFTPSLVAFVTPSKGWEVGTLIVPLILVLAWNLYVYIRLIILLTTTGLRSFIRTAERGSVPIHVRILFYLLVFIFCWFPDFLYRMMLYFGARPVLALLALGQTSIVLFGFFDTLVYAVTHKKMRLVLRDQGFLLGTLIFILAPILLFAAILVSIATCCRKPPEKPEGRALINP